jgi:hypothetical protein
MLSSLRRITSYHPIRIRATSHHHNQHMIASQLHCNLFGLLWSHSEIALQSLCDHFAIAHSYSHHHHHYRCCRHCATLISRLSHQIAPIKPTLHLITTINTRSLRNYSAIFLGCSGVTLKSLQSLCDHFPIDLRSLRNRFLVTLRTLYTSLFLFPSPSSLPMLSSLRHATSYRPDRTHATSHHHNQHTRSQQ